MAKIAINGFGRIGRSFFRATFGHSDMEIVAINDLTDVSTLAYLLKYDSVYGRYAKIVETKDGALIVDGKEVRIYAEKDPVKLPWKKLDVDVVVESTGFFTSGEKSHAHITAGAKRVVISAPASDDVLTALVGVNDDRFGAKSPITCNASCTTNSVAPVLAILKETLGVEKASMVTVHGYTATQKLVDGPDEKDVRRGRAAAINIVPSTTGAAKAVIQSLPDLEGRFQASAIRVPVIAGSLSVINAIVGRDTTVEDVNALFRNATASDRWKLSVKIIDDPLVSTDIIGEPYGAIVDSAFTSVLDNTFVTIFSWYDNEAGYTATLVEHVKRVAHNIL
jgi:glyceraldehyde 3-phosphate dehydrogenase